MLNIAIKNAPMLSDFIFYETFDDFGINDLEFWNMFIKIPICRRVLDGWFARCVLGEHYVCTGWALGVYWVNIGCVLSEYYVYIRWILKAICTTAGRENVLY